MKNIIKQTLKSCTAIALINVSLYAQNENAVTVKETFVDVLEPFSIIGSKENVADLKGSGFYIDNVELETFNYTDINQILRSIPGVYTRAEEGYGLFPNISLRGVDAGRSKKVTIMEDGIPSAPSPFSDPAAYYSPTAGRMAGFEILKGSSQVKYGPQTTGGVINYISTPIPDGRASRTLVSYGSEAETIFHLSTGDLLQKATGQLGYLVEVYHHQTDGWRTIQGTTSLPSSDDTGFKKKDYMLKLSWRPRNERHYFEFKYGRTDLDGDVGYTGLSTADFAANPYQRYATTRYDNMDADHTRGYLRHLFDVNDQATLTSSIFYNKFNRDWYKLADITPTATGTKSKLSTSTLEDANVLAVLKGTAAGTFRLRHNDRTYTVRGVQSNLSYKLDNHSIETGVRYTHDVYDSNPYAYGNYSMDAAGNITQSADTAKSGSSRYSKAWEFYVQDTLQLGNVSVTPGVRHTRVNYDYKGTKADVSVTTPGVGFEMPLDNGAEIFGGYYRGQALPGPSGATSGVKEEVSNSFELGIRKANENGTYFEAVGFQTSFENMVAQDSVGLGTTDRNFGEATTKGLEFLAGTDLNSLKEFGIRMPLTVSATYTNSEFDTATTGDDFWGGAATGNAFPYIPELQFNARLGLLFGKTDIFLNYQWVDEVYTSADNSGKIDSYGVLDLSVTHRLNDDLNLFGKITNVTKEEYATTRLPAGYRSGAPRLFSIGANYRF